jgi:hypothetical protein
MAADPEDAALAAALRRILDGADDAASDGDLPPEQAEFLGAVRRHLTDPPRPKAERPDAAPDRA